MVNLVWYDKEIKSKTNQYHVEKLATEFLEKNHPVIQMDDKNAMIQLIITDTEHDIILITSGSAGQEVISEIGSFWNIKGIIIFCGRVEQHQAWARSYKKVLLITDRFDEVIQTIKDVQTGAVYFLNRGFTLDDITLKLPNIDYYLSIGENGFIITDFSVINSDIDYQKNKMLQLYDCLISKKIYPDGLPLHFTIDNLFKCAEKFSEALKELEPENKIIYLYTLERPYFYKIVNEILNLLDKELMSIIGDYITALRYALLKYSDTTNTISKTSTVKLYRGIHWENQTDVEQFLNKFKQSDIIVFPSFSSTSLNKHTATSFIQKKGVLLEITADCTQLNKPKNIGAHSHHKDEDEVLLNCFSLLKVNKIRKSAENVTVYECNLELIVIK